jgi:hypothetical protein
MSNDKSTHELEEDEIGVVSDDVEIMQRNYFSLTHIGAGALCARQAGEIEQRYQEEGEAETSEERNRNITNYRSYVTNSIVSTVSFLEASVNELLRDAAEDNARTQDIDSKLADNVQTMENNYNVFRTHSILEKYQLVLLLSDENLFDTGTQPYQDVSTLKKLRNYLVHYTPEDIRAQPEPENPDVKMGRRLQDKGFDLNPLVGEGNPFFPDKCLSHGCASWGVDSALYFTDEFYSRLDIEPPYEHMRDALDTEPERF